METLYFQGFKEDGVSPAAGVATVSKFTQNIVMLDVLLDTTWAPTHNGTDHQNYCSCEVKWKKKLKCLKCS